MYKIYRRINILTGKSYIGLTKQEEKQRWKQHIMEMKRYQNSKLTNALKKYGTGDDIWQVSILEDNIPNKNLAGQREIYWIWYYDSHKNGYNSTDGGNIPPEPRLSVAVVFLDYNTGLYCEFNSVKQAAAVVGCHVGGLSKALYKSRLTLYNYYVFYKEQFDPTKIPEYLKMPRTKHPRINNHTLKEVCKMR
jgi:hypothetical protein